MMIPLLDLNAQNAPLLKEIRRAMDEVLDSNAFILGPQVARFEEEMQSYLGVKHAIGCANGSDALVLALKALGVGCEDEVITTPFSFFATAGSISRVGATPVFVDIDPNTFNLDVSQVSSKVTRATKAIIPVHLFGQMAQMKDLKEVADKHGLRIIEDAAQAVGAKEGGRCAGTVGDAGTLSFFPSKNLGAFGDGGMVVTNDDETAARLRSLRVHGASRSRYHHAYIGTNSRLDTLQAAILSIKLKHLSSWTLQRRVNAGIYNSKLAKIDNLILPVCGPDKYHVYNQYTVRVKDRAGLQRRLQEASIGSAVYYPMPLHLQECYTELGGKPGDCPHAERVADEVLSLPIYAELTAGQIARVCSVVAAHVRG